MNNNTVAPKIAKDGYSYSTAPFDGYTHRGLLMIFIPKSGMFENHLSMVYTDNPNKEDVIDVAKAGLNKKEATVGVRYWATKERGEEDESMVAELFGK